MLNEFNKRHRDVMPETITHWTLEPGPNAKPVDRNIRETFSFSDRTDTVDIKTSEIREVRLPGDKPWLQWRQGVSLARARQAWSKAIDRGFVVVKETQSFYS